ncbi:MAG: DUF420 domain-containing protein [Chloroherpetonaceae bacterium]|nr:DUF420 domain-containing protein [Chloroherpetonaceae bacterium]
MEVIHKASEKKLGIFVYSITIVVASLVTYLLIYPKSLAVGNLDVSGLPRFHAFINGTCFILLIIGLIAIMSRNFSLHKIMMLSTFVLSAIFLVSYVLYHSQAAPTKFGGIGSIKYVYYFILVTHILLATIILPLALFTIARSWRGEFEKHKKVARWTLPIWLYVTLTGVLVYLMISPYYLK